MQKNFACDNSAFLHASFPKIFGVNEVRSSFPPLTPALRNHREKTKTHRIVLPGDGHAKFRPQKLYYNTPSD